MTIFLILTSLVIWSTMLLLHWRTPLYRWLDNKFDFERFRKSDKEENNS
ncbi:hypothetical protein [Acetobacter sp.]|nr:hypothetical protein [Acetobacter sp.]MCH4091317.1 hypothetical protein [Acetobacter sp.]MCI1299295.1 hypothetical protein [Acetobacter sp.]MCI1316701.1 hypothetical protein [Acetobacter sp.]